ncbi:MAG: Uma2 family endonuclease [Proteobacteria bacterium]|nr:Uma2 family endonuclease [Pseudomonadota bacterium]
MPAPTAIIDANDPRAPTQERWDRLSADERSAVVAQLPAAIPPELFMPEGDRHRKAKASAISALDAFFRRIGRKVYLSSELNVFYPGEPRFHPDVLAVLDVDPGERDKWVVSQEGKGLDWVLEVHVWGELHKDQTVNVERYARLGIPEYFIFDRLRGRLTGYRLATAAQRRYQPILAQHGRYPSAVLGLELALEQERLRFYYGTAPLPEADELALRLESMVDGLVSQRLEAEERAEQEQQRADRAEARLLQLEAEFERLRRGAT